MMEQARVRLVPYSREFLHLSGRWLRDIEVKALTLAPDFTTEQQLAFFNALPQRDDYKIWGVEAPDGTPIGAAGIKHIAANSGEFWCYIGERDWWGRGLGGQIYERCEDEARRLGLKRLTMVSAATNTRSIAAFEKMGFVLEPEAALGVAGLVQLGKIVGS